MSKVIIVGSINVDTVFNVERHPQVGETIRARSIVTMPGGKGANQAVAAAKAGAPTYLVGAVGNDSGGQRYLQHLRNCGVDTSHIRVVDQRTGSATITVDERGENSIIIDPGANGLVGEPEIAALTRLVEPGDYVSSMYEIPSASIEATLAKAAAAGAHTVFNPSPWSDEAKRLSHSSEFVVVNEHEAHQIGTEDHNLIMTFGSRGALWGGEFAPAPRIQAVDSTGAGDVFTGTLISSLAQGSAESQALRDAVAAGSHSCTHQGAQLWTC